MTASEFTCAQICMRLAFSDAAAGLFESAKLWNPGNDKGLGFMEQTVALLDDHQDTRDFNVVRQSPNLT